MIDLAVVAQDPRFAGGSRTVLDAFWREAEALDRRPRLFHLAFRALAERPGIESDEVEAVGQALPQLDALNQLVAAARIGRRVREVRSLWVVAAAASHGYAAVRSGRPYAAWIGTSLDDEWRARLPGLPRSRRLALRVNRPVLRRLERRTLRGASLLYATSPWSRDRVAEAAGLDPARVGILPIPVDADRFPPLPDEEWERQLERPAIAFVGRAADPRKNVRLLLEALPAVRARVPGAHVRLLGEPPPRPLPAGVTAAGRVPDVGAELRRAALLVVPSLQEGFGIVAAEALACRVPVVTTPCGGPEALVRESGGGRVLQGFEPEELAATLTELLEDVGTLRELRRRGRSHVLREHSPERLRRLLAEAFATLDAAGRN
jgi:glycosyltransferase involved in cell wall biosynthesis